MLFSWETTQSHWGIGQPQNKKYYIKPFGLHDTVNHKISFNNVQWDKTAFLIRPLNESYNWQKPESYSGWFYTF